MKRAFFSVLAAVLSLAIGGAGRAEADVVIGGGFEGISDFAGVIDFGGPILLPPTPFSTGFIYTDNGITTSIFAYALGPPIMGLDQYWYDTFTILDSEIPTFNGPYGPFSSVFFVDNHNNVHINLEFEYLINSQLPFDLSGVGRLLSDGTVDAATFQGQAFWGGDFAFMGGPIDAVPEPSNLMFGGFASLMGLAYAWRHRKSRPATWRGKAWNERNSRPERFRAIIRPARRDLIRP